MAVAAAVQAPGEERPPAAHGRREALALTAALAASALQLQQRPAPAAAAAAAAAVAEEAAGSQAPVLSVGQGRAYPTISAALEAAPPGATVEVAGGRYVERLLPTRAVTIAAAPGEAVEVAWATQEPYRATVEVVGVVGVVLRGLRVRHSSPSVANNYAVRLEVGW